MKIAQVIIGYHPRVGGYGRHVNLISTELRERGHDVIVLSTNFSPSSGEGAKRFWNTPFLKITPGLITHLVNNDYDVVHVHGYPSFQPWLVRIAHYFKKFPLVFTPHYHPFGTKPMLLRRLFDKFFGEPVLRGADRVIALTAFEKSLLDEFNDNVSVIPNPVPLKGLRKVPGFRKKHGLGKYLLFVGRLERDKGINYLIEAAGDMDVVIIGRDAGFKNKIKRKPNVHLLGEVSGEELMSAYTECSALVLPSKYEAFGIVFIEAMAYGKPVIGTDVGPVPSVIDDAGLVVPYGDINALRRAIKRVLDSHAKFRPKALKLVKQYDVKRVVDKIEKVYDEVLK